MASDSGQGSVIDITVKTLDGQNHTFSVSENLNIQQFKEHISSSINIPANTQRLIFQGRVMQDDKILKDYNVHGKVIHLVQRAPPTTVPSSNISDTTSTPSAPRPHAHLDDNQFDVQIHLGRPQNSPNSREARARIRQADFNIRIINEVLRNFESSEDSMDASPFPEADRPAQSHRREQSETLGEGAANNQQVFLTATELADFLDRVLETDRRVIAHIRRYQDLLRSEENYPANSREAQNAQEVVNRITEIFHALGHMMHSLSDVTVNMSSSVPRQALATPPVPFQIQGAATLAIPIQMNVRARPERSRNRQRSSQPADPAVTSTPDSRSTRASQSDVNSTGAATTAPSTTSSHGISTYQIPAISGGSFVIPATSGASMVMVEVLPTNVTVHDIRAEVISEGMDVESDSGTDSNESLGGANITGRSTTTSDLPSGTSAAPTTIITGTSAPSFTSQQTPLTSASQTTGPTTFTTSALSSSTFTFGSAPTSVGGGINQIGGQISLPGLPPGIMQNILGSLFNSLGALAGQPAEVSVSMSTPGRQPDSRPAQQLIHDLPLDDNRSGSQNPQSHPIPSVQAPGRVDASLQTVSSMDTGTGMSVNASTNTTSSGLTVSTSTLTDTILNTNASTNTTSNASSIITSTMNLPNMRSSSSISLGTGTDPSMGTSSRSTNTPRPFLIHMGSQGQARQQPAHTRPPHPGSLRPGALSRGYVDPYLPCSSPQYMSPTALAALSALQGQTTWQQQHSQQIPNLSTMVSGMVGQAAQQALSNGIGTSTTFTSSSSNSSPSFPLIGATTTTTSTSGITNQQRAPTPMPSPNPLEFLMQLLNVTTGTTNQSGPMPAEFGSLIGSLMQAVNAPTATTTGSTPTLAELFSYARNTTEDRAGVEPNIIISLLEAVAPQIELTDLFSLVMGNVQVLNRVRGHLQEFVSGLIGQYGSVEQVVEASLRDMVSGFQHMQSLVQVRDGTDMAQSLYNCLQSHLLAIFTAISSDSTGSENDFGSNLFSLWMKMLAEAIGLCIYCIQDGFPGFLNMLQNFMPQMMQGLNPMFTSWITMALQSILGSFYWNHPIQESDITGYVVNRQDSTTGLQSQEQINSESKASSTQALPDHSQTTTLAADPVGTSENLPLSPMDTALSPKAKMSKPAKKEVEANNLSKEAHKPYTRPSVIPQSTLATPVKHTEKSVGDSIVTTSGRSSQDWQTVVPQEWIPVISRDIVRQQEQRPQPPFSDAYLQGHPAKRRRMMSLEHCREMGNMPRYLPDSLKRAARAAGVEPYSSDEKLVQDATDNLDLHAELEREMTTVLESRISSDHDFNSERFPNTEEYFLKTKQHK